MKGISCDRCGRGLYTDAEARYVVRIEVTAAYDPLEIVPSDLQRDLQAEMADLSRRLEGMSEEEVMAQVHTTLALDLCATCRPEYLSNPLGRVP